MTYYSPEKWYKNIRAKDFVEKLKGIIILPNWEIIYSGRFSYYWIKAPSGMQFGLDLFRLPLFPKLTSDRSEEQKYGDLVPIEKEVARVAVIECWREIYRQQKVENISDGN